MSKTAVVTGASGNLGPIWVNTLRMLGYRVFGIDLPEYDVSDMKSVAIAARNCVQQLGTPEVIVNNAAIDNPPGSGASFFGNFSEIIAVNLTGAVNVTQCFLPNMIINQKGLIVNIGSIQGYGGADWHNYDDFFEKPCGYNLSKWGLRGFTKSLSTEYSRYGIRAVTISFGCVDTPKIKQDFKEKYLQRVPLGRMISRESLESSLIYAVTCPDLTGVDWRIDGGLGAWA